MNLRMKMQLAGLKGCVNYVTICKMTHAGENRRKLLEYRHPKSETHGKEDKKQKRINQTFQEKDRGKGNEELTC